MTILAQVTGGRSIIEDSIQQVQNVQQAWDKRWLDIFNGANGLYLGINKFAAVILVGAFLFFALEWIKEAIERGIFPAMPNVIWVLVIFVLLFNNGKMLGTLTLSIRNIINDQTKTVLEVQVGEVSMLEALNDVIVSQQAKTLIQQQYAECEAKEGKAQIDCFQEARKKDFVDINGFVGQMVSESLLATAGQAAAQSILKGFQWAFANLIELSMLLTGLIGPIAAAGSMIPMSTRPLWAWLIGFFSLGLAKFSYNVIIGLAATVVVAADAQSSADIGFLLLLSILAPVLALALATGGGMAIFRSVSGGVTRIVSVGTSFLPIK
jgi:hypothetical protein